MDIIKQKSKNETPIRSRAGESLLQEAPLECVSSPQDFAPTQKEWESKEIRHTNKNEAKRYIIAT